MVTASAASSVRHASSPTGLGSSTTAVKIVQMDLEDRKAPSPVHSRTVRLPTIWCTRCQAAGPDYAARDRRLAETFAAAAADANVQAPAVVYLGGLGEAGESLSEHLASRREVEQVLSAGTVPVTVFRAAMIIGSGSASFEILRYLAERLPVAGDATLGAHRVPADRGGKRPPLSRAPVARACH